MSSETTDTLLAGLRGQMDALTRAAAAEWERTAVATQQAQVAAIQAAVRTAMAAATQQVTAAISSSAERALLSGVGRAIGDVRGVAAQTVEAEVQAVARALSAWRDELEAALRWRRWRSAAALIAAGLVGAATRVWVAWCLARFAAGLRVLFS